MNSQPTEALTALSQWGDRREKAQEALDEVTAELRRIIRAAAADGVPKVDIARAAGVSRPTVDKWLEEK